MTTTTNHIVIDLETMGNGDKAAIVSIGAYRFDPNGAPVPAPGELGAADCSMYLVVDLESSVKAGLEMDAGTVLWWLKQSEEARAELVKPTCGLEGAMIALAAFIKQGGEKARVWGHGATFDPVIVKNAYKALNYPVPFDFRDVRDTRTIFESIGEGKVEMPQARKHNALWDAWREAVAIQACYRKFGELASRPIAPPVLLSA